MTNIVQNHDAFLRQLNRYLGLLIFLMVSAYFTWSENVAITRLIKVVGRMGVMTASIWLYYRILARGAVDNFRWQEKGPLLLYGAYLLLGFASLMWSTDVGYSALQWFMTTQTMVFCYFFIKSFYLLDLYFPGHSIRFFNLLGNSAFWLILIFVVGMWISPDVFYRMTHGGEEARLGGYLMNPNELGMLACVGLAGLLFDFYRDHQRYWTAAKVLILCYGLYATGSRSSLIAAMLIIGFHIKLSSNVKLKAIAIAGILLVGPVAVQQVIFKGGDAERMEEVMSMTGRLPFWTALINEGLPREPWFGFGFMRIAYKDYFKGVHTYPGKMTHNTFIQVLMNLGFVGFTIVLFQMLFTLRAIRRSDQLKQRFLYSLMIPLMVNSLTEFGIFGETNYGILFYQLAVFFISFGLHPMLSRRQQVYLKRKRPELAELVAQLSSPRRIFPGNGNMAKPNTRNSLFTNN